MLIKCRLGGEMIDIGEGEDPHAALDATGCSHCADSHGRDVHCGRSASGCDRAHDGACWNGEDERPDGCAVCRPVVFMAGVSHVGLAG